MDSLKPHFQTNISLKSSSLKWAFTKGPYGIKTIDSIQTTGTKKHCVDSPEPSIPPSRPEVYQSIDTFLGSH